MVNIYDPFHQQSSWYILMPAPRDIEVTLWSMETRLLMGNGLRVSPNRVPPGMNYSKSSKIGIRVLPVKAGGKMVYR